MAAVPYKHVEAPWAIDIGGTRAFNAGDPVPFDTAERIGLMKKASEQDPPLELEVFGDTEPAPTTGDGQSVRFHDDLPKNPGTESPTPPAPGAAPSADATTGGGGPATTADEKPPKRQRSGSGS